MCKTCAQYQQEAPSLRKVKRQLPPDLSPKSKWMERKKNQTLEVVNLARLTVRRQTIQVLVKYDYYINTNEIPGELSRENMT